MGLGKTLQSLCIVAGDHYHRVKEVDVRGPAPLPSLVVCPPTLTGHWCYEVRKFCNPDHCSTVCMLDLQEPGIDNRVCLKFTLTS